jgi:transcription elongation factor GreB
MQKKTNYITPTGFKRLINEQELLLKVERPEVTRIIQWAASNGDRSENADYIYGKKRLREIDRRLRFLAGRINDAVVINPEQVKSDKVQFGAKVTTIDENNKQKTYHIVGVDEIDLKRSFISWKSPIAKAMLGKATGDIVEVNTPEKCFELEIIDIEYGVINFES